jgi:hypothetical protein
MLKQFLIIGFVIVFSSCGRKEKDEEMMTKMLNKTLLNAANNVWSKNEGIYNEFKYKLENPASKEKAFYLKNKMDSIKLLSNSICDYINSLKSFKVIDWVSLNEHLNNSKKEFLSLDEDLTKEFASKINNLNNGLDSISNCKKEKAVVVLNKLFCDVKLLENELIIFLNSRILNHSFTFDSYSTLVGQNVSHLKNGEELIISAGLGTFSSKALQQITIAQKDIPVINGQATYKFKPIGKVGKHTIPIKIEFKDEYDNIRSQIQAVEYTIDP